jgi:FMN-dependent NADH-azoreductase
MKVLHIDSSILGDNSVSRALTHQIVEQYRASDPATTVDYLDLAKNAPTHLDSHSIGFRAPPQATALTPRQVEENAISEQLVSQFLAADVVVIGAPLYNFTVPTQLRAWIDRIAQPGRTFGYTDKGPHGLAGGKTVVIASTRGGVYSTSEGGRAMEHQETYLQTVFGFLGITDVRFVRAEGVAMGPAAKTAALQSAALEVKALAKPAANQDQAQQAA